MFAQRLIDQLFEAAKVEFEHQLAVELESGPATATINVTASFEEAGIGPQEFWGHKSSGSGQPELSELTYVAVALHDANGHELALTDEARSAIQASFGHFEDELTAAAYEHFDQSID